MRYAWLAVFVTGLACGGLAPGPAASSSPAAPGGAASGLDGGAPVLALPGSGGGTDQRFALVDPGINGMTVFEARIPAGWTARQSFTREWPSAVPNNVIYVGLASPDGAQRIEFFPTASYAWQDGPMARDLRMWAQQAGLPETGVPPMAPVDYAKRYLVPKLAERGVQLNVTGERAFPDERSGAGTSSRGYVEGVTSDGRKVRVEAQIQTIVNDLGGERYYAWTALPILVQSGDIEATYATMRTIQASVVWNPAWQRENNALVHNGSRSNSENSRKQHEARMDAMRQTAEIRDQAWADRQASQERQNAAFNDMIRGEARYDDASGQRVRVDDGYNHVYTDGNGNYVGTQAPAAPTGDWQEMQRVQTQDY